MSSLQTDCIYSNNPRACVGQYTTSKRLPIKAHRPLMRDTLNAPWLLTNRQFQWTGNCHSQLPSAELGSRVLISTCSARLVQTGEQFFTVWPWPMTLTYNPRLEKVKVDPHAKNQAKVNRFKQESAHRQTDRHTDATKRIVAHATQSIIIM